MWLYLKGPKSALILKNLDKILLLRSNRAKSRDRIDCRRRPKKNYARHLCDSLLCISDELLNNLVVLTTHAPEGNASLDPEIIAGHRVNHSANWLIVSFEFEIACCGVH